MDDAARAHLIIEGSVQGVFFRAYTRDIALSLGLRGWVRNLPDGNVEAVFEGDKAKIQELITECYKGPPSSRVSNIDLVWENYRGEFESFDIRY
jgi:acylphosphatase